MPLLCGPCAARVPNLRQTRLIGLGPESITYDRRRPLAKAGPIGYHAVWRSRLKNPRPLAPEKGER
jgi:hypothetical protein